MHIRPYKETDFESIANLYNTCRPDEFYGETGHFTLIPWAEDQYMMSILSRSDIFVYESSEFGANEEQSIIGFCGITGDRINWLFVSPNQRGHGIGQQLLSHLLLTLEKSKLESGIALSVWKSNQRAKYLYLKHGFHITAEFPMLFQGNTLLVNKMLYKDNDST